MNDQLVLGLAMSIVIFYFGFAAGNMFQCILRDHPELINKHWKNK